jgi:hypothetical protein
LRGRLSSKILRLHFGREVRELRHGIERGGSNNINIAGKKPKMSQSRDGGQWQRGFGHISCWLDGGRED